MRAIFALVGIFLTLAEHVQNAELLPWGLPSRVQRLMVRIGVDNTATTIATIALASAALSTISLRDLLGSASTRNGGTRATTTNTTIRL